MKKVTETFASFTSLVESAICTLAKILLLTKERASTPVIYPHWLNLVNIVIQSLVSKLFLFEMCMILDS